MKAEEIVQRLNVNKLERLNVEMQWDDVERFIMPLRLGNMQQQPQSEQSIEWNRDDIYDTTAIYGAQIMAAAMHGSIVSQILKWFNFNWRDDALNKDPPSRGWLDKAVTKMYSEIYDANFDPEISSAFQDLTGPGNTCMTVEAENDDPNEWEGLNFTCIPIREIYFEQDHRGRLARLFRLLEWTALQIVEKFVTDDYPLTSLPKNIQDAYADPQQATKKFKLVFCIYNRLDKKKNRGSMTVLAVSERPFGAKYVLVDDKIEVGMELGYYDMPSFVCRFEKTSGSQWGHGPGVIAAPTAKYINSWMELEQAAVRVSVDPPSLVTERGLLSDLDQGPGGITMVRDVDKSVRQFRTEGRIDLSKMQLKELRDMLREMFKMDELRLKDSPAMSATEAQIRYELMNRVLGPTLARIQTDLLGPMLMRIFFIMLRAKQFDPMPDMVKKLRGQIKIDYSGPLMRAQQSDEAATLERFSGTIAALMKMWPELKHVVKPQEIARAMALKMSVPANVMNTPAEVERAIAQDKEMMQQMAQAQTQQEQGKGMKVMGEGQQAMQMAQKGNGEGGPQQ